MPNSRKRRREAWLKTIDKRISEIHAQLAATGLERGRPLQDALESHLHWDQSRVPEYTAEQQALLDEVKSLNKQRYQVLGEANTRSHVQATTDYRRSSSEGKRPKFAGRWGGVGTHKQAKVPSPRSSRVTFQVSSDGLVTYRVSYPASFLTEGSIAWGSYCPKTGELLTRGVGLGRQREAFLSACKRLVPKQPAPTFHPKKGDRPGRPVEVWQQAKEAVR